jgi:hypothetical protein
VTDDLAAAPLPALAVAQVVGEREAHRHAPGILRDTVLCPACATERRARADQRTSVDDYCSTSIAIKPYTCARFAIKTCPWACFAPVLKEVQSWQAPR